jgi:hypothetical protein
MEMTEGLVNWTHEQKCRKAVESFNRNGFTALYSLLTDLHVLVVNAELGF